MNAAFTILVCEARPLARDGLVLLLEKRGHRVAVCDGSPSSLAALHRTMTERSLPEADPETVLLIARSDHSHSERSDTDVLRAAFPLAHVVHVIDDEGERPDEDIRLGDSVVRGAVSSDVLMQCLDLVSLGEAIRVQHRGRGDTRPPRSGEPELDGASGSVERPPAPSPSTSDCAPGTNGIASDDGHSGLGHSGRDDTHGDHPGEATLAQAHLARNTQARRETLSPRELDILRCLIDGQANKVIARECEITESTVKVHLKAILRKIRVSNRTQAAVWAHERLGAGLYPFGPPVTSERAAAVRGLPGRHPSYGPQQAGEHRSHAAAQAGEHRSHASAQAVAHRQAASLRTAQDLLAARAARAFSN